MASWRSSSAAWRPSAVTPPSSCSSRWRADRGGRRRRGEPPAGAAARASAFLERHGGRGGIGPSRIAGVEAFFTRHGGKAIVLGRFTGFLRATLPFVAGSSGMAVRRLVPFSVFSAVVLTATFLVIGYVFSESPVDRAGPPSA